MSGGGLDLAGGYGTRNRKGRAAGADGTTARRRSSGAPRPSSSRPGFATFTIAGIAHSRAGVRAMLDYIADKTDQGWLFSDDLPLVDAEDRAELVEEWDSSFPTRSDGRHALHLVVSSPEGSDPEAVERAAEEWVKANLGDWEVAGGLHTDTKHPHYHMVVARRPDSPKLDLNRETIVAMRQSWAEIGTRHGVPMIAPRWYEREAGKTSVRNGKYHAEKKRGYSERDLEAAKAALSVRNDAPEAEPHPDHCFSDLEVRSRYMAFALEHDLAPARREQIEADKRAIDRQAMTVRRSEKRAEVLVAILDEAERGERDAPVPVTPEWLAKAYGKHPGYQGKVQGLSEDGTLPNVPEDISELTHGAVGERGKVQDAIMMMRNPERRRKALATLRSIEHRRAELKYGTPERQIVPDRDIER